MSMYSFFFDKTRLPVTPSKVTMKINNRNETASLINDTTINRLKAPGLTDISFSAMFPLLNIYPFAKYTVRYTPAEWLAYFEHLKMQREPFKFILLRWSPDNKPLWDTNLQVSLEDYEEVEDAEDGDDLVVNFNLKTFEDYNTKTYTTVKTVSGATKAVVKQSRPVSGNAPTKAKGKMYTVKQGDCLWTIARRFYGNSTQWQKIYTANKATIEATAKKYGRASSSNGWWIYPGEVLNIP